MWLKLQGPWRGITLKHMPPRVDFYEGYQWLRKTRQVARFGVFQHNPPGPGLRTESLTLTVQIGIIGFVLSVAPAWAGDAKAESDFVTRASIGNLFEIATKSNHALSSCRGARLDRVIHDGTPVLLCRCRLETWRAGEPGPEILPPAATLMSG